MKLLSFFFIACGLCLVGAATHWSLTDVGVVRQSDNFYVWLGLLGIVWADANALSLFTKK